MNRIKKQVAVLAAAVLITVMASPGQTDNREAGGLIGHWPMDDGKGHVIKDVVGLVGDGQAVGAEWVPLGKGFCLKLGAPFKAGIDNEWPKPDPPFTARAALTDGFGYARLSNARICRMSVQNKLQTSKTVSLWVKPVNGGVVDPAGGAMNGNAFLFYGSGFLISVGGSGRWYGLVIASRTDRVGISGPPVTDQWTHLALMNDEVFARLYVNGKEIGVESGPYLVTNAGFPISHKASADIWISFGLGESGRLPPAFAGYVDDVKLYDKALTPAEVMAEFEAGREAHQE